MNELSLEVVQSQLPNAKKLMVDQGVLDDLNKLSNDIDYGPEFLESYLSHLKVLADAPRANHTQYLNAMKFFSLVEAGNTLTDAYIKVFPERYEQAKRSYPDPEAGKEIIRGNASRYNSTKLLSDIRRVATIPVQLVFRHTLIDAIQVNAELMHNAKSEMVRQKAAADLMRELKPSDDAVLEVKVDDGSKSIIQELVSATEKLAAEQHQATQAGLPLKQIARAKIFTEEEEVVDEQ
jgi:hypothetical protein